MRDYDPATGRYLQADPLGLVDGASVYGYARQNPGRYVDPRGEQCVSVGTDSNGNTLIECGPEPVCWPGQDCGWRDPTENNRSYDECQDTCEMSYNDLIGGLSGEVCAVVIALGAYCGGTIGASITAGVCYSIAADSFCRKQCGY
jgi:uncharacterized protein RhaS with RHS repeats